MLYSKEKCTEGKKRPHFSLWFGNFFEPYYHDKKLVSEGMKEIADMGFNSIILDSKLWEDFTEFFKTGKESEYVAMQRYMIDECAKCGMGINFLTLFYNGDNLYPHIRDSKPDIINPVIDRNGEVFRGYRHWDDNQTDKMIEHSVNLYDKLALNAAAKAVDDNGNFKIPCYFYHSPALMPSFDEDGKRVYIDWLKNKYQDISKLNAEYGTEYSDFSDVDMLFVWPVMSAEDYKTNNAVRMKMHRDNMLFRQDKLAEFYEKLTKGMRERMPDIFLYDCLSQWKIFITDWVEISERGLDLWRLAKFLDSPSYYTLPADAYGEPNAYSVSVENAILRSATVKGDPVCGLFLGRYLYNDIYAFVTPGESIASCFGAGGKDMFFYGYSGLDDGGNFGKWEKNRKMSVKRALDWFSEVREISGKRIEEKKAALIFPYASFTMENRRLNDDMFRKSRNDFLGYYQQLCDLGINADVLDRSQIDENVLGEYKLIVLPSDYWYSYLPDKSLENALYKYAENGGRIICAASSGLSGVFGAKVHEHAADSFVFEEEMTEFSAKFFAFENVESLGHYLSDNECVLGKKNIGKGTVYFTGFDMGACYCERAQKPVPVRYGKAAQYPLTVTGRTPIEKWLFDEGVATGLNRGIEKVAFENGTLIINHTVYEYSVDEDYKEALTPGGFDNGVLYGHNYVFLVKK